MKTIITRLVLLLILMVSFTASAKTYDSNTLIGTKLVEVNFFEAIVDVEFYMADDRERAFLNIYAGNMSRGIHFSPIRHGFNKIKIIIQRDKNKNSSKTTKKIDLFAFENLDNPFWEKEIDFEINWPGPDYVNEIIGNAEVEYFDYSSVGSVVIVRHAYDSEGVYEDVLRAGVPIYKAVRFGMLVVPSDDTRLGVQLGVDVEPAAAKKIISFLLNKNHNIVDISIGGMDRKRYYDNDIVIKPVNNETLSASVLSELKQNKMSDADFYALLGIERPTTEDYIKRQYEIAYGLIDSGQKENLSRAKNILDEIISKEPGFTDAYVELARYRMKTMGATVESFKAAEKVLLIAKDIDPEHANTRVLLGYVYTNQDRFEEAESEYELGEKIGTDNSWLYANWGLNDEKQSNIDQAINHYVKVMDKPRKFDRNDRVQRWTKDHLFPLLVKKEKYSEADKFYTKYINDFPSAKCVLLSQAENQLFNLGDYEAAIQKNILAAKKGCHKKSDSLAVAYYLKWYATDNGNSTKDSVYRQAEAMAPDDARLFYYLARSEFTAPVIALLIKNGRNFGAEDQEGLTALLLAVYVEDYDAVNRLVSAGADIDGISSQIKIAPLGLAALKQNVKMVRLLIDNNANTEIMLPNGVSIYKWAKESGHDDISRLLGGKQSI